MPVAGGGFVTRVFGLGDDPKPALGYAAGATFMNRPWARVAGRGRHHARAGVAARPPHATEPRGTPACIPSRRIARRACAWRCRCKTQPLPRTAGRPHWLAAPRLSLAESAAQADGPRLLAELAALEDTIATRRFYAAVEAEQPALEAKALLGSVPAAVVRRSRLAAEACGGRRSHRATARLQGPGRGHRRTRVGRSGVQHPGGNDRTCHVEGSGPHDLQISNHTSKLTLRLQPLTIVQPYLSARPRALISAAAGPTPRPKASSAAARCSMPRSPCAAPIRSRPRLPVCRSRG